MAMKVAIIGAGCSGLAAIKCCLEEGLDPTCFEKSDDIGGLWKYSEMVEEGRASIYQSVFTNTSKEMMCYSDFPMPEDFPVYLHHSKILEYLHLYAEHFDLLKYIQCQTEVCQVTKSPHFSKTGQWEVLTKKNGTEKKEYFDAVLVCNGHHVDHYLPLESFPGIQKFKGRYIHSRFYKKSEHYQGKNVLVVGIGNSAGDISVEISSKAKQVYLSTRQGTWVVSRISHHGYPIDMALATRFFFWISNLLPANLFNKMNEKHMSSWFDHENYGLEPENRSFFKEPIVNDYLPSQILCGAIKVKPNISTFTETSVIFEDGSVVEDLDAVIFATGYSISFPFLEDSVIRVDNNKVALYKNVFPLSHEKPTMAFLGLVQPLGSLLAVSEIQARWATQVFKVLVTLSSRKSNCYNAITVLSSLNSFGRGRFQTLQTFFISYMDEIAVEIGVRPNIVVLFLKEPSLAWNVFFGPCTPYQYRLTGPGKWSGARKAILTQWNRTLSPAKTRVVQRLTESQSKTKEIIILFGLATAILSCVYYIVFTAQHALWS
ncbi:unnamed protein product [Staurois parvus]|uniref:Flavin-containing monooxygenase n=1 Tax=Staurois parvus TaxID=386267 RepID=A0ABN9BNP6_9NEOB|nr:unnamed protein product [Staurois parvus]